MTAKSGAPVWGLGNATARTRFGGGGMPQSLALSIGSVPMLPSSAFRIGEHGLLPSAIPGSATCRTSRPV